MKTIEKPIQSIDLWVAVGTNDVRAVKGAFTDDMHILGECAYDRYKIVKNCNFLAQTCNCHSIKVRLRPKQTAVVFYKQNVPVRLLAVDGHTPLQGLINMAMVDRVGRVSLQRIIDERGIKASEIDLKESAREFIPTSLYEDELDFFSCNRWSLFKAALTGNITDHDSDEENSDQTKPSQVLDLVYYPNVQINYRLRTDTENFDLQHCGMFCNANLSYLVALQVNSPLAPQLF